MDIAMLFNYIGILVILTNIIVEVLKKITWDKFPTNILVVIISLILTLVSFFAYTNYKNLTIEWYYVVGAIVIGFLVAYAAMFGYDKLKQMLKQLKAKGE